jgi:anti-sigma B factor antagonist
VRTAFVACDCIPLMVGCARYKFAVSRGPNPVAGPVLIDGSQICIPLSGELDMAVIEAVADAIRIAAKDHDSCTAIVVDLNLVTFIDSSNIGGLVPVAAELIAEGRSFRVVGATGVVATVIQLTGVEAFLCGPPQS